MLNFIRKIFSKKETTKVHVIEIPELPVGYALKAETNRKLKKFDIALDNINKAIDIEPNNGMYWITKALIYRDIKDYNKALESINKAIDINPSVQSTKFLKNNLEKIIGEL